MLVILAYYIVQGDEDIWNVNSQRCYFTTVAQGGNVVMMSVGD